MIAMRFQSIYGRRFIVSVTFIINFKVKDEKLSDFLKIMRDVKFELPKTEGCMGVTIHNSIKNPSNYTIVERWESEEYHEKHVKILLDTGAWDHISSHLVCDPVSDYYEAI
jgi:heme-degrading monooxygenase HmoA